MTADRNRLLRWCMCAVTVALMTAMLGASAAQAAIFASEEDYGCSGETFDAGGGFVSADFDILHAFCGTMLPLSRFDDADATNYFGQFGFDRNFMLWAPRQERFDLGGRRFAGCETAHAQGTFCAGGPSNVEYDHTVSHFWDGKTTVKYWAGAFISLVCGNMSEAGNNRGPVPTISGIKYEDLNANGRRDDGEPTLPGWKIRLMYGDTEVAERTTGADGSYEFSLDAVADPRLASGTYSVLEVDQTGWTQEEAPASFNVPLGAADTQYANKDFGNWREGTIAGRKFEDLDADVSAAGDPGVSGWDITATRIPDSGPPGPVAVRTTAAGGGYSFSLRPGRYVISEASRAGWNQSAPATTTYDITVISGQTVSDRDFGNWRPVTIHGYKYGDNDADGVFDSGEPSLAGWLITLSNGASRVTGSDGSFRFEDLRPGRYTVSETEQAGYRQTAPAPAGGTHTVTLQSGQTAGPLQFGNVCLGSSTITVRDRSTGRIVLPVDIRLEEIDVADDVITNDPSLPRTSTSGNFGGLLPGRYRVIVFLPSGQYSTDPDTRVVDGRWATVKEIVVTACRNTPLQIDTLSLSNGKITGGMKNTPGGFATAGFEFQTSPKGEPRGTLQYNDHADGGPKLHTNRIDLIWVSTDRTEGYVWGTVDYQGASQPFRLHLVDLGEPGSLDRFELDVLDVYRAGHGLDIVGGNVQIHKQ